MKSFLTIAAGVLLLNLSLVARVRADTSPAGVSLFDPARHMRVSEVRPGMTGYGVSVFSGTALQRFDVEVVSVLRNFNPKYDVVLIRCKGADLEHTGPIAGMSGSPIYLHDDTGKDRMIGAFAYGWPQQKDPIAGVQPIEYMLNLPPPSAASTGNLPASTPPAAGNARWNWNEAILPRFGTSEKFTSNTNYLGGSGDQIHLEPMVTPLMTSGMPASVLKEMEPIFRAYGLEALQAGGSGGTAANDTDPKIEPGSVLAVPLLEGDVDMSAVGTCTDRIGDHVVAFGHSFLNEGPISLPLAGGSIQGIIANYETSFKLGSPAKISGTLTADRVVGIVGELGKAPPMVPIDLRIKYTDGSEDQTYHFTSALHSKLTPLLSSAAVAAAVSSARELPEYHTLDYDFTLDFVGGRTIHIVNSSVNTTAADIFFEIGTPLIGAAENPFDPVLIKDISGTLTVTPQAKVADILYANVPKSRYRPGDVITAYVTYRPFRGAEMVMPVTLTLPRDLPDGTYQFTISDWQKYLDDEKTAEPFKFTAETIDQVFDVLRDVSSVSHKAIYVRLLRQPDGIAIGHTAMPKLPSSRRQVMMDAGRSDTTEFVSSALKISPTDYVMSGSCDFDITVDQNANTDLAAAPRPPRRDVRPNVKPVVPEAQPKPAEGDGE
jgi:hypothetical protein